jgi:hypothetical protein
MLQIIIIIIIIIITVIASSSSSSSSSNSCKCIFLVKTYYLRRNFACVNFDEHYL